MEQPAEDYKVCGVLLLHVSVSVSASRFLSDRTEAEMLTASCC